MVNLWVPSTNVPKEGAYPRIDRVLAWFTGEDPEGKRWMKDWLAAKVRNPGLLPKVAAVLATKQGAGKGFLFSVISEILGRENCATVKQHELGNQFNSRWVEKLMVLGDEVLSSENVRDLSPLLKILVDGGEIERQGKHKDQTAVKNRIGWIFASNDKITPISLEDSDRRFSVFTNHGDVPAEFKDEMNRCFLEDRHTFTPDFMEEVSAFHYDLLHIPVDEAFIRRPYDNDARSTLIANNMKPHEMFFERVTEEGIEPFLEAAITKNFLHVERAEYDFGERGLKGDMLYKCYKEFVSTVGGKPLGYNRFCGVVKNSTPWTKAQLDLGDGKRPYVFVVPRSVRSAK